MTLPAPTDEDLLYPETDGKPMGESSIQIQWIMTLHTGFTALFRSRPDVFVGGDLFWYPVEGESKIVTAPDVMVAFGRPKGHRRSYRQWREDNTPPQVVIEVQSPSNTSEGLDKLFRFYRKYGVEEYYLYDPESYELMAWRRDGRRLVRVRDVDGFVSPRLGVRFEVPWTDPMRVVRPDGQPFLPPEEYVERAERAEAERQRAEAERQRAEAERQRADALAARLRQLGLDPDAV